MVMPASTSASTTVRESFSAEVSEVVRQLRHLSVPERIAAVGQALGWTPDEMSLLRNSPALSHGTANRMVENALGVFGIPLGLANHFVVNGQTRWVPMATEEPSVIAAASLGARLAASGGGFFAKAAAPLMVAQIQLLEVASVHEAARLISDRQTELLELANLAQPGMKARGGGAKQVEVRFRELNDGRDSLVVHLVVDVCDAMGANVLNSMAEAVAPMLEEWTQGRAAARILSNYADKRVVKAECSIPLEALETEEYDGLRIARGVEELSLFAEADVHRAVTHNKGIMNGIDAVALATGNDLRAIEAGAHAYAARNGRYGPLSVWRVTQSHLVGKLELPLQVGIAGKAIRTNPLVSFLIDRCLGVSSAQELSEVIAAVGLAQNLAALRALGSEGIIRGHMALHRRR